MPSGAAVFTDMTTAQNIGYCTAQCWYDNVVYTPAGAPDVVYLGGSFSYGQLHAPSNGRAWLLSTDGGATWSDLTQDGDRQPAEVIHPDQHAIVTVPGKPLQFITGSDGGVVRSDGKFADVSDKCDTRGLERGRYGVLQEPAEPRGEPARQHEQRLVDAAVPEPVGQRAAPQNLLQGGTQDNGTFQFNGSAVVWPQVIYGDGGQSGFNAANDALRFNTFTGQANDANFRNGDPTKWVIISAPIVERPEGVVLLSADHRRPEPGSGRIHLPGFVLGMADAGLGRHQAFLEANCPEFTTSATQARLRRLRAIGPPAADQT